MVATACQHVAQGSNNASTDSASTVLSPYGSRVAKRQRTIGRIYMEYVPGCTKQEITGLIRNETAVTYRQSKHQPAALCLTRGTGVAVESARVCISIFLRHTAPEAEQANDAYDEICRKVLRSVTPPHGLPV